MIDATIQRYTDIDGDWRWRLVADDGHPLADGVGAFESQQDLDEHLDRVTDRVDDAVIIGSVDDTSPTAMRFVLETGHDDEWRWGLFLDERRVADSGEGYADQRAAVESAERTKLTLPDASMSTWGS